MENTKAKYFKMVVTTTYVCERVIKANSQEEADNAMDNILHSIDLLDDVPDINVETYERPDMDDDDVEIDLTKENPYVR